MLKTFPKGGVHPAENKISAGKAIETLPVPKTVTIPLSQHIGAPSKLLVKRGDSVKVGQVIAESSGFVSTNIHSSVSGKVKKIDNVMDSSGFKKQAVIIDVEGDDWVESIIKTPDIDKDIKLESEDIIKKVLEGGIVGLGGATFPSHVKLSVPKGKTAEVFIINGVECEPYLTSDHQLMMEKGEELIVGTRIMMKALKVNKGIIGIENNKPDAIKHISKLVSEYPEIQVVPLKVQYPQGGEKQLIKAVTGREVPSGALPIEVGAVVHNVGTAFAAYEMVQKNKPLFERVVTLTGKSVKKPSNFLARVGTPVDELIEAAGGLPEDTGKVVGGGPMMGKALSTTNVPVTKGTSGILILNEKDAKRDETVNCIRCGKCVSVCPMGLEPYLLAPLTENKMFERLEKENILDCMECGSCSYICPSNRPLLDYIRLGKGEVTKIIRSRQQK